MWMEPGLEVRCVNLSPNHFATWCCAPVSRSLSWKALAKVTFSVDRSLFRTGEWGLLSSLSPLQLLNRLAHIMEAHCVYVKFTWRTVHHKKSRPDSKFSGSSEERHWAVSGFLWGSRSRGALKAWLVSRSGDYFRSGDNLREVGAGGRAMKKAVPRRFPDLICFEEGYEIG